MAVRNPLVAPVLGDHLSATALADADRPRAGWPRALFGGLLSLIAPGLGQVHARAWHRGLAWFGAWLVVASGARLLTRLHLTSEGMLAMSAGVVAVVAIGIGAAVDAVRSARRAQPPVRVSWWRSTWLAGSGFVLAQLLLGGVLPAQTRVFSISSGSMMPTLLVGDDILVSLDRADRIVSYGDVIVFTLRSHPDTDWVKRVIALPGDRVRLAGGEVFVNDVLVPRVPDGDYLAEAGELRLMTRRSLETLPDGRVHPILKMASGGAANDMGEVTVLPDHLFVMGDNRDNSMDSRFATTFGLVPLANVLGHARAVYFSANGTAPLWQFWAWPAEIRWARLFTSIT